MSEANREATRSALDGLTAGLTITRGEDEAMEQYLFDLTANRHDHELEAVVRPNIWLLSAEEVPPLLFTTQEVARLLGIGHCRVYDLIRARDLRSVKVGASRRVSARALRDYVDRLEGQDAG